MERDAGINHMLAPTDEHTDKQAEVALATSVPLQLSTIHEATWPDHWGITHKQPVSQYGQGVLLVEMSAQSAAHSGKARLTISAKPLMDAVWGTEGYVAQLDAETRVTRDKTVTNFMVVGQTGKCGGAAYNIMLTVARKIRDAGRGGRRR